MLQRKKQWFKLFKNWEKVSKVTISNQIISERIRVLREIRDFTSKELANKIGMHPRAYSSYETGEYNPDGAMLAKLAEALDIDIVYFFSDEKEAKNIIEEQLNNEFAIFCSEDEELKIKPLIEKLDLIDDHKSQDALLHLLKKMMRECP